MRDAGFPLYATRKQRRHFRRARQRAFATWAQQNEYADGTTSLRWFMRPRGWLGKSWRVWP